MDDVGRGPVGVDTAVTGFAGDAVGAVGCLFR